MADKAFGVKDIDLIGASGTPTIECPGQLNITCTNVAISTDITVGEKVSVGAGTSISSPAANILTLGTNNSERLRVTGIGSVGIGTDHPEHTLVVGGSDVLARLRIRNYDDAQFRYSSLNFKTENGGENGDWSIYNERSTDAASSYLKIFKGNGTGTHMYFKDPNEVGIRSSFYHVDANGGDQGDSCFGFIANTANPGFKVKSGGTERFRIDSSGNAKINDGNLVIGTSGHGIDFSATTDTSGMSSELLDDYEEGIHTVAFSASTSGTVTVSSGDDQVSYVKIGNHVTVTGRPVITSVSSPQGNLRMTLPFTSADLSDSAGRAACALNVRLINSGYKVGMMSAYLDEGSNVLNFSYGDNNDSQPSAPAIKSGTQIWINISYRTT